MTMKPWKIAAVHVIAIILIFAGTVSLEEPRSGQKVDAQLIRGKRIVSAKNKVTALTEASPIFFHLLKHKPTYMRLEKISTTPPPTDCICVPYYVCDNNQTIITDGVGTIDVRFRRCTGDLEVCCYLPSNTSMQPVVTPTNPPTTPTTPSTTPTTPPTTPTTPPTTPTTPPTTPTTPPTTPTTPPTTPTTPPTTPTTPPTTPTTPPTTPPVVFPTAQPTISPPIYPPGIPNIYCVCVSPLQCDPSAIVGFSGEGIINPRQQLGLCGNANLVCCRVPPNGIPPIVLPTVPPGLPGQSQFCYFCGNTIQCTNGIGLPGDTGIINPRLTYPGTCGIPAPTCCQGITGIDGMGALKFPGTDRACYCVKSWYCLEGNVVSLDGAGIIDPRFSACTAADEVCCKPIGINVQMFRESISLPGSYIVNDGGSATQIACGMQNKTYAPAQPPPPNSGQTYFGEFPWMVALLTQQPNGQYLFQCGGSLISNTAILTAAHCVLRDNGKLVARFGQWDLESSEQPEPFQEQPVKTIVSHPLYNSASLHHDVAIIILDTPVQYNVNIAPICLPQQGMIFAAGSKCYGTGWGRNAFDGPYQAELRKVEVPVVERTDCQTRLRNTRLGPYFLLHGSFMCAGGETNKDTCRGDGGGPLVCPSNTGQFVQAGIVSWGIGCGTMNVPAVYASVAQHRQWINQQLANYGAW